MAFNYIAVPMQRKRVPFTPLFVGILFFVALGMVVASFKQAGLQVKPDIISVSPSLAATDALSEKKQSTEISSSLLIQVKEAPEFAKDVTAFLSEPSAGSGQGSVELVKSASYSVASAELISMDADGTVTEDHLLKPALLPTPIEIDRDIVALSGSALQEVALQKIASFNKRSLPEIVSEMQVRYGTRKPKMWGEQLGGITSTLPVQVKADAPVIALTFDACGGKKGSGFDERIITFLREKRIPATLFITTRWARANAKVFADLSADSLFEIAAHGAEHRPCAINGRSVYGIQGTANLAALITETEGSARELAKTTGKHPLWFRAGTAYYDDVAVDVIRELGMYVAGYSIAADEGATLSAARITEKLLRVKNGDIVLLHMNRPKSDIYDGLVAAIPDLQARDYQFVTLSSCLTGRVEN